MENVANGDAKLDKLIPSSCIYEHKKGCENNNKKNCSMKSTKMSNTWFQTTCGWKKWMQSHESSFDCFELKLSINSIQTFVIFCEIFVHGSLDFFQLGRYYDVGK